MDDVADSRNGCYFCGAPASSVEHVPPKCLFPERKDAFGEDLRRNLITVPSCHEHNLGKARDDEFLMVCLTSAVGNNGLGFIQTNTKVRRAVERTSGRLLRASMLDPKPAVLRTSDGTRFPILVGRADAPRLCGVLEHIARGLYLHACGERFEGKCQVMPEYLSYVGEPDLEVMKAIAAHMIDQEVASWPSYGDNPKVFHAELGPVDQYGMRAMVMTFYQGARVFAAFQPTGVRMPHRTLAEATADNPLKIELFFDGGGA